MNKYNINELKQHNGIDKNTIWICINNKIYDVSQSVDHYGPDAGYSVLAGSVADFRLATMNLSTDIEPRDLTQEEIKTLNDWEVFFDKKYKVIGFLDTTK